MNCIYCNGDTSVINSRPQKRTNSVWRRRKCQMCDVVITTLEKPDLSQALMVRPHKGPGHQLQPFARDILLVSLYDACRHRPNAIMDASGLVDTIVNKLIGQATDGVITRDQLVYISSSVLNTFDEAAYISYKAFHPVDKLPY